MTEFTPLQTSAEVIDALGGTRAVADYLGVGAPAISNYRKNGFPAHAQIKLADLCARKGLRVDANVVGVAVGLTDQNWRRQAPLLSANHGLDLFERAGYSASVTSILQSAEPFIELLGEEMRRRLFTFSDPRGDTLCLRPDLTIPTARAYIEAGNFETQRLCYAGTAFRYQPRGAGKPEEFTQIGLEILNGQNAVADEQEVLTTLFNVLADHQITGFTLTMNDLELFSAILEDLDLSPRQHARLMRGYAHGNAFESALEAVVAPPAAPRHDFNYVEGDIIVGRSGQEIKARLDAKLEASLQAPLASQRAEQLRAFSKLACPAAAIAAELKALGLPSGARVSQALDTIAQRVTFLSDHMTPDNILFAAGRGRKLAYYTGFMFEISVAALGPRHVIASGGRYDGLLRALGAPDDLPAMGAALAFERLCEAGSLSR